jgi:spore maturation protein CgeB
VKVPHVSCLIDPPYRFLELTKSPWIIISCDDQEGCSLLRERNFDRTFFLPHAVGMDIETDQKKRIYDVVFLGTCINPEIHKKQWKKMFSSEICTYMEEAARISLEDGDPSFMSILATHLDPETHQQAFEEVELYIKGVDRLQLVEAFTESNVHVFGSSTDKHNWQYILKKHQNIMVHPPVSYEQAIEVMKQSKLVLNSSIKNKYGAHERIFTASACGAVVVTNAVPFMEEHFKNKKELLLFSRKGLSKLESEVQILLKDESKRLAIAEAGRKRVMKVHTWDCRVEHLLREVIPMLKKIKKIR